MPHYKNKSSGHPLISVLIGRSDKTDYYTIMKIYWSYHANKAQNSLSLQCHYGNIKF